MTVLVAVFAAATLASAWLMFSAEPLLAKMLLPLLGGAPAVWNASLVFFQGAVLAGYAAAYGLSRLGTRAHAAVHAVAIGVAWLALPFHVRPELLAGAHPSLRVIAMLALAAGIPFFVLAMNGPAIARVLAGLDVPAARDPYWLYAASNAGSLFALVAYPFAIERWAGLREQARLFGFGWIALAVLAAICAALSFRTPLREPPTKKEELAAPIVAWTQRLRWLALAAIPSAQLLGVTQFITTDVAPAPLLWVVPLAVYLLSFVLVFATRIRPRHALMVRLFPLVAAMAALTLESEANSPAWVIGSLHVGAFAFAAMVCHGELADDRPEASRLTEFYLWMSGGGVLGGLLVALVSPIVFSRNVEYPLALVFALLARPGERPATRREWLGDLAFALAMGLLALGCFQIGSRFANGRLLAVLLALPVFVLYRTLAKPVRFALALGATLVASGTYDAAGHGLFHTRNFFGALRVQRDSSGAFVQLVHGTTVHGRQTIDPAHRREAATYYHSTGPAGDLFALRSGETIGVIGLGAGSLAAYARPNERWTFFEINPAVVEIATNPKWFTFLSDAFPKGDERIVVGDARLELARLPDRFDLLVVDAFSSDAIPMHLLTLEALDVYLAHLAGSGTIAFHCSNRHLDLEPVLAALAKARSLEAKLRFDQDVTPEQDALGKTASTWVAMTRQPIALPVAWRALVPRANVPAWTDDASSIVPILF